MKNIVECVWEKIRTIDRRRTRNRKKSCFCQYGVAYTKFDKREKRIVKMREELSPTLKSLAKKDKEKWLINAKAFMTEEDQ